MQYNPDRDIPIPKLAQTGHEQARKYVYLYLLNPGESHAVPTGTNLTSLRANRFRPAPVRPPIHHAADAWQKQILQGVEAVMIRPVPGLWGQPRLSRRQCPARLAGRRLPPDEWPMANGIYTQPLPSGKKIDFQYL